MPRSKTRQSPELHRRACRVEPLEDRRLLAGVPELVKDINTTPNWGEFSSAAVGSTLFFTNYTEATGTELWKSDGTPTGTALVKDVRSGSAGSYPKNLTSVDGKLFFAVDAELWVSDGTEPGTVRIKDVRPGAVSLKWSEFVGAAGKLFFNSDDGLNGRELWVSDGTSAGTMLVRDINPGAASSDARSLESVGGLVFFRAIDGSNGFTYDLWRSDGTESGTKKVMDLLSVPGLTEPGQFTPLGDVWLFAAADPQGGSELWRTDWTPEGTFRVKDIRPGAVSSGPNSLTAIGDTLYFTADDGASGRQLWISDGTAAGTLRVTSAVDGLPYFQDLTQVGDRIVGAGLDDQHGYYQLWSTDGSEGGMSRINGAPHGGFRGFVSHGDRLFFIADPQLWSTDGTEAGTRMVKEFAAVSVSSVEPLASIGDRLLLFGAADQGVGLWQSDGTPDGTVLVKDVQLPTPSSFGGYFHPQFATVGDSLLFFAADSDGYALWKSDGTDSGTQRVAAPLPNADWAELRSLGSAGGRAYFATTRGENRLWTSDGSPEGTFPVGDADLGGDVSIIDSDDAVFVANDTNDIGGLWAVDDHSASKLIDGKVRWPTAFRGSLLFTRDGALWKSDGNVAGTLSVAALGQVELEDLTVAGNTLYFTRGNELWRSNGTPEGTVRIHAWPEQWRLGAFASVGDKLFFTVGDRLAESLELWTSDGTEQGTTRFSQFPTFGGLGALGQIEGRLVFVFAGHGVNDFNGLWVSDGNEQGTRRISDQLPDGNFLEVNGTYFFTVALSSTSRLLWRTDGTTQGTVQVSDFLIRSPQFVVARRLSGFGGALYFSADDGVHGEELWKLEPIPGDTNFDNVVDVVDFGRVKANFGRRGDNLTGELDYDGDVDLSDFGLLKAHFGERLNAAADKVPAAAQTTLGGAHPDATGISTVARAGYADADRFTAVDHALAALGLTMTAASVDPEQHDEENK